MQARNSCSKTRNLKPILAFDCLSSLTSPNGLRDHFDLNSSKKKLNRFITRPNCALDRRKILCLYVPGFQRQVYKHVKILSEKTKEQRSTKGMSLLWNPLTTHKMHSLAC